MTSPLCDGIESCSFTSFNLGRLTTNRSEQHVPTTQDTTGRSAPFGQLQARPGSPAGVLRRQYRDNFLGLRGGQSASSANDCVRVVAGNWRVRDEVGTMPGRRSGLCRRGWLTAVADRCGRPISRSEVLSADTFGQQRANQLSSPTLPTSNQQAGLKHRPHLEVGAVARFHPYLGHHLRPLMLDCAARLDGTRVCADKAPNRGLGRPTKQALGWRLPCQTKIDRGLGHQMTKQSDSRTK